MSLWAESPSVYSAIKPYFTYLRESVQEGSSVLSSPYIDASGLGLIMTASSPVYVDNEYIGAVGLDATLQQIEDALLNQRWGSVYSFLINEEGRALIHPLLKSSDALVSDPIYPDILDLEGVSGTTQSNLFRDYVRGPMIRGETGEYRINDVQRRLPKGDKTDGETIVTRNQTYYYTRIPNTGFSFAYVLQTPQDQEFRTVAGFNSSANDTRLRDAGDDFYHRVELYATESTPARAADLDVQHMPDSNRLYPGLNITTHHSVYKLAPSSFCNAQNYILDVEATSFSYIDAFMRAEYANETAMYPNPGCDVMNATAVPSSGDGSSMSARFGVAKQVRADVELTHAIDPEWRAVRTAGSAADIVWTYAATVQGVFRIYPGTRMPHAFDPTRRPWFMRSVASQG